MNVSLSDFRHTYSLVAGELLSAQSNGTFAPPACKGPCVRALSSDFDLRRVAPSEQLHPRLHLPVLDKRSKTPITEQDVFTRQNKLFCLSARATHEFMEHKCLSQGLLVQLGLVDPAANLYCAFAGAGIAAGWPSFRADGGSQLRRTLERAPPSWVLKSATDQNSKNVLVMSPEKWTRDGWNVSAVVAYSADVLAQPTMEVRCPSNKGERRAVLVQRKYPWSKKSSWSERGELHAEREPLMFEIKVYVVWGKLGSAFCYINLNDGDVGALDGPDGQVNDWFGKQLHLYFDEHGKLSLGDKDSLQPGNWFAYTSGKLRRVIGIVRRAAPTLQRIARDVSRLFAADYWRLDAFLSDGAPPHINELTYPSFIKFDARDLRRLREGYDDHVERTIVPVPASCVANRIKSVTEAAAEPAGGLTLPSRFFRLFGGVFSHGAAPEASCAPYLRQISQEKGRWDERRE